MAIDIGILLAFASGAPLAALGLLLIWLRPRRRDQIYFGLFAVVWGIQIAVANLGRILQAETGLYASALLVGYALLVVATLLLARFLSLKVGRRSSAAVLTVFGSGALLAAAALAVDPALFVRGVAVAGGSGSAITLGPAVLPLVVLPFYGAFYATVTALYRRYRQAEPGSDRHRVRGLLVAMALFPAYASVSNLIVFLDVPALVTVQGGFAGRGYAVLFAAGTAVMAGLALHAAYRPPRPEGRDPVLLSAFVAPMAAALAEAGLAEAGLVFESLGIWRIATVGVLVYALARHRLFDLDLRLKAIAGPGVATLALGFGALVSLTRAASGGTPIEVAFPVTFAAAVGGAAWSAGDRLGDVLFPGVGEKTPYLDRRRLEVYRSHLEEALAGGDPDEEALERLRDRLGISDREDAVMRYLLTKEAPDRDDPDAVRFEPGATVGGRYRIRHRIGEGAHGRVHLAYDEQEERQVVAKVVGTMLYGGKAADLLLRETGIVAGIDHPNVVEVLDVIEGPHEVAQIMAYAEGGSLRGLLDRRGAIGPRRAVALVDQVLAGLAAAHAEGVVHRDVKPENLLLTGKGRVAVADFGVAHEAGRDATGLTGGAIGTLLYMSPEQIRGGKVGPASDLYAVGVVLHELLTGRYYLPLTGRDDFQVRRAILQEPPDLDLDDQPARVRDVVRTALAKDPADRYASADAMRDALDR